MSTLDELYIFIIIFMSNQVYIRLVDGDELYFNLKENDNIITENGCMIFIGSEISEKEDRKVTIHLSNVLFHRHFKENMIEVKSEEFLVHYKGGEVIWMLKWDVYISWDYLVCDTDYDATFIPMKNIKYHETF